MAAGAALAQGAEWTSLFNGKDFEGWGGAGKTELNGYVIRDGMIEATGKCRNLVSEREYADYIMEFEFQLTPGANNGLGIHYPGSGNPAYAGMELQILDNSSKKYEKLRDFQYHGSLYSLLPADRGGLKPVGEWNFQRVTCRGPRITVELNGRCILDADLEGINKAHPDHAGAKRRRGKICFAGHGDVIRLRGLRVGELSFGENRREDWYLPPGRPDGRLGEMGFVPLFDGRSLDGWKNEKGHENHWAPRKGWILHYDGRSMARDKNLWSSREFKDFTLVCDWRWVGKARKMRRPLLLPNGLAKAGPDGREVTREVEEYDSGIYLRGSPRTQVNLWNWPVGSGEVWGIRTDGKQPLPVRAAVTPRVPADRPVGQWNRFVITMKGDRLTVVLNGKVVVHEALLPGVKPQGPLALQHHGNAVEFANLFVKPL